MACSQTLSGIPRDCESNAGGIKEIYIANIDDVSSITLDSTGASISAISMASSKTFKKYYFKPTKANVVSTPQFNDASEYVGEDAIITMSFGRQDTTKRVQVAALSIGELVVIVKDMNGTNWLYGYDNPVLRNGGDAASGAAKTDFNGYNVQLHATDNQLAYAVPDSVLEDII